MKQAVGIAESLKTKLSGGNTFEVVSRRIILNIFALIGGFLLARCNVFAGCIPFGTAFVASLYDEFLITGGMGAATAFLLTSGANNIKYIGALILCAVLKYVIGMAADKKYYPLISMASAFIAVCFSGVTVLLSGAADSQFFQNFAGELLLSSGTAYFIATALPLINSNRTLSNFTIEELTAIVISVSIGLATVSSFDFFGLSPAKIVAAALILFAAKYGYISAGAVCGTAFGFAMCLTNENEIYIVGAYALGGLAAGSFARVGTPAIVAAFCAANAIIITAAYSSFEISQTIVELALGGALFLLTPKKTHAFFNTFFAPAPHLSRVDGLRSNMVMRMQFASDALCDVSQTVDDVAKALENRNSPTLTEVFMKTENKACTGCGLRIHCYEESKTDTYSAFLEMTKLMRKKGRLFPTDYPENWQKRCLDSDYVSAVLYEYFYEYSSRIQARQRISQIRSVVADQMNSLSDMLFDMSVDLNESERFDVETADSVSKALYDFGISATDVCCKIDRNERMSIEISAKQTVEQSVSKLELVNKISRVAARRFSPPCIVNNNSKMLITLTEKENFKVDIGVSQLCPANEKLCGDSYSYFNDGRGKTILILSDGMGSGGAAAVDSTMAAKLISRLVKAGFGFDSALKLVNSALMFKSGDESLATVDITAIDLYSGQADFYKAGTPETIVMQGTKTGRATCNSYPAGILNDVKFDKTSTVCKRGDIVVMMSDGVTYGETDWIDKTIDAQRHCCAQEIAETLASLANRRRDDDHQDDITVMVAVLEKAL